MSFLHNFDWMALTFILMLAAAAWLTLISRCVQLRAIPLMCQLLVKGPKGSRSHSIDAVGVIDPRKALLTAMSTTIGIGNIFGPIVAIAFAGPGALLAYLLATLLGASSTYTEVFFALRFRRKFADGQIEAGPMAYIQEVMPSLFSTLYALSGSLLLAGWSMSQSHTLAHMVSGYSIPCSLTGALLAIFVIYAILNGTDWIAELNTRLVPVMFLLYLFSGLWIIGHHWEELPSVMRQIYHGFWHPRSLIGGVAVYSVIDVLRWGLARALQSNEAGLGTSTIPHSLSHSHSPSQQAVLAMASTYSNGLICMISGLIYLTSGAYSQTTAGFDAHLVTQIFRDHFQTLGEPLILAITLLFAIGTILGNAYNGTHCFAFLTRNRWKKGYIVAAAACVWLGSMLELKVVWGYIDYLMVPVALPHAIALVLLAWRHREIYELEK